MVRCRRLLGVTLSFLLVAACAMPASAELSMFFAIDESYNDNVIGLTADNANTPFDDKGGLRSSGVRSQPRRNGLDDITGTGGGAVGTGKKKGDFSTHVTANIGYDWQHRDDLTTLIEAEAAHSSFSKYSQFDFTIGTVSVGVRKEFTDDVIGKLALNGKKKWYRTSLRDSNAYGLSASLKEHLGSSFWLKETGEVEKNTANSASYSYTGSSLGLSAGYEIASNASIIAGYTYFLRNYDKDLPPVKVTSQLASLDMVVDLSANWSVSVGYDHEWADANLPNTATTNNIYTIGVLWYY